PMTMRDPMGLEISGADHDSLHHYQDALAQFQCYVGDPLTTLDAAQAQRPEMIMAHVLRAWLNLLGTEPDGLVAARAAYRQAAALPHNAREQGHLKAIGALLDGRWKEAGVLLEDV